MCIVYLFPAIVRQGLLKVRQDDRGSGQSLALGRFSAVFVRASDANVYAIMRAVVLCLSGFEMVVETRVTGEAWAPHDCMRWS